MIHHSTLQPEARPGVGARRASAFQAFSAACRTEMAATVTEEPAQPEFRCGMLPPRLCCIGT
jgi:hypothetical protein